MTSSWEAPAYPHRTFYHISAYWNDTAMYVTGLSFLKWKWLYKAIYTNEIQPSPYKHNGLFCKENCCETLMHDIHQGDTLASGIYINNITDNVLTDLHLLLKVSQYGLQEVSYYQHWPTILEYSIFQHKWDYQWIRIKSDLCNHME